MRRTLARGCSLLFLFGGAFAVAQQPGPPMPVPRITSVFPAGGQAGTTLDVTVLGTDIDEPTGLIFSHPDIKAELLTAPEPAPDPKGKMQPKKAKTGPTTSAKFKVTVPANVPAGTHDARLVGRLGLSNPRAFVVGDRPEVLESDKPHNDVPVAQRIELGSVLNGTISTPTDVDYYVVAAKAGRRVLAYCATSSIDSKARPQLELFDAAGKRLALNRNIRDNDALLDFTAPSDGDYFIRIVEFAYQTGGPDYFYRLSVHSAPYIDAVFPPAVKPGTSTPVTLIGRNLPGGKPTAGLSPDGRPLESLAVTINAPADGEGKFAFRGYAPPTMALQDAFEYSLKGPGGVSNAVPIYLTNAKVIPELDADNDKPETAQPIELPCEVVGRIEKRYDKDWYGFTAKKGDAYYFDLQADRIGSGMDVYYAVKNLANMGNAVEEQDDDPDALHPTAFYTRSGDPAPVKFTAQADGKYAVLVASRESNITFGPRSIYRLKVTKPAPDFRAVVMAKGRDLPSCTVCDQGGESAFDVFIDRRDGFNGPVAITVDGLPGGASTKPNVVGTGSRWGTVVVATKPDAAPFNGLLTVNCTADINGKKVSRSARPASLSWGVPQGQANIPLVSRLDQAFFFSVRAEKSQFRINADLTNGKVKTKDKDGKETELKFESPLYVKPGDKLTVPVKVTWQGAEARSGPVNLHLEPYQPGNSAAQPVGTAQGGQGTNAPAATMPKDKDDLPMVIDVRSAAAPGRYTVALRADTQIPVARDPAVKDKKTPLTAMAYAQPFEVIVLPTTLAKLTPSIPPAFKIGATTDVPFKIERLADYTGEYTVKLVPPKGYEGLSAPDVTVPAGKDEFTLPVTLAPTAKPNTLQNVPIEITGTVHGKFPVKDQKLVNLPIVK